MKINVINCNSIDYAEINIEPARLNIKYGSNGTGKSTIAKAIEVAVRNEDLHQLLPFKHRGKDPASAPQPQVKGLAGINSVFVFNEAYVSQFVFQQDEVIKNSFEIFIKSADYDAKMAAIEESVACIKVAFNNNKDIEQVLRDLAELSDSFGKSKSGIAKSGRLSKAIGEGNNLDNIPESLSAYSGFIKSDVGVKWIGWQLKGKEFIDVGSDCPYCAASIEGKRETILAVGDEYDVKSVEHLVALKAIFDRLGKYFSNQCAATVAGIINNKSELTKEEAQFLVGLKGQVDTLKEKLIDLRALSFFSLRDIDGIEDLIKGLRVNLALLPHLGSVETESIVGQVNGALDTVLQSVGKLKGEINIQKRGIQGAINKYKAEINDFLRFAGYRYEVDIQPEDQSYKMRLQHIDFDGHIDSGAKHLSYGERNAFAIVLFMYECLTKSPDLIVLDDPISSFDKTKKFAMLQMLFRGRDSLQGRTVLMLTHDLEPVIDMVKCLAHTFNPVPVAGFLTAKSGVLAEVEIKKGDLQTFTQICAENIAVLGHDVIKLIYMRRLYEILDDKGLPYQMISSLLHKRPLPIVQAITGQPRRDMTAVEIVEATTAIKTSLPTFDYSTLYAAVIDNASMLLAYAAATNGYERLQLFRVIQNENHDNDILRKYVNEAFHIENEQIMQLNPHRFDWIPDYIVVECNKSLGVT